MACRDLNPFQKALVRLTDGDQSGSRILSDQFTEITPSDIFKNNPDLSKAVISEFYKQIVKSGTSNNAFDIAKRAILTTRRNNPNLFREKIDIKDLEFLDEDVLRTVTSETVSLLDAAIGTREFGIRSIGVNIKRGDGKISKVFMPVLTIKNRQLRQTIEVKNSEYLVLQSLKDTSASLRTQPKVLDSIGKDGGGKSALLNDKGGVNLPTREENIGERIIEGVNASNEIEYRMNDSYINSTRSAAIYVSENPNSGFSQWLGWSDTLSDSTKATILHNSIPNTLDFFGYAGPMKLFPDISVDVVGRQHALGRVRIQGASYEIAPFDFANPTKYGDTGALSFGETVVSDFKRGENYIPKGLKQSNAAAKALGVDTDADGNFLYDLSYVGPELVVKGKLTRTGLGKVIQDDLADVGEAWVNRDFNKLNNHPIFAFDPDYREPFLRQAQEAYLHRKWVASGKSSFDFPSTYSQGGYDGSNSAFQQIALGMGSKRLGRSVNLTQTAQILDAYEDIVDVIIDRLGGLGSPAFRANGRSLTKAELRKAFKTSIFTTGYNVGETRAVELIIAKLKKLQGPNGQVLEAYIRDEFWDIASQVYPDIFELRDWSRKVSRGIIQTHNTRLEKLYRSDSLLTIANEYGAKKPFPDVVDYLEKAQFNDIVIQNRAKILDDYNGLSFKNFEDEVFDLFGTSRDRVGVAKENAEMFLTNVRVRGALNTRITARFSELSVSDRVKFQKINNANPLTVKVRAPDGSVIVDNFYQDRVVPIQIELPDGTRVLTEETIRTTRLSSSDLGNAFMSRVIQGSDSNILRDIGIRLKSEGIQFQFIHDKFNVPIGDLQRLKQITTEVYADLYAVKGVDGLPTDELRDYYREVVDYLNETGQTTDFEDILERPTGDALLTGKDVRKSKPVN